jgi:hypothetical protein
MPIASSRPVVRDRTLVGGIPIVIFATPVALDSSPPGAPASGGHTNSAMLDAAYDKIIIGGGSAGCVLCNSHGKRHFNGLAPISQADGPRPQNLV